MANPLHEKIAADIKMVEEKLSNQYAERSTALTRDLDAFLANTLGADISGCPAAVRRCGYSKDHLSPLQKSAQEYSQICRPPTEDTLQGFIQKWAEREISPLIKVSCILWGHEIRSLDFTW